MEALRGSSCLTQDGSCSAPPAFIFESAGGRPDGHRIVVAFALSPSDGPGTYELTDDKTALPNAKGGLVDDTYNEALRVRSGTLVVSRSDREALQASFDIEMESLDGQHVVSLTGGWIDVSGCFVGPPEPMPCNG